MDLLRSPDGRLESFDGRSGGSAWGNCVQPASSAMKLLCGSPNGRWTRPVQVVIVAVDAPMSLYDMINNLDPWRMSGGAGPKEDNNEYKYTIYIQTYMEQCNVYRCVICKYYLCRTPLIVALMLWRLLMNLIKTNPVW